MFRSHSLRTAVLVALALSSSTTISAMARHTNTDSGPAVRPEKAPRHATVAAAPAYDPARAWVDLGCIGCHGEDGIYRDEIQGGLGKPVEAVARWIRNAPSIKPQTDMPNFEGRIDGRDSVALARWVLDLAAQRHEGATR
jgi:hypothetical protein